MKFVTKNIKWFVLLSFFLAGFFVYANSLSNQLFWDDDDGITNNLYIKDLSYLPRYFSENLIAGSGQTSNYWRPLVLSSFALNYQFFGLNPVSYHVTNILLHILAAWLSFLLIYKLSRRFSLSFWPAFFLLIHPLQTEAITYVSGIADPLSAVFCLLALLAYVIFRQEQKKKFLAFSLLAFLAALLSKEQSITLPALIFLVEMVFFFKKTDWRKSLVIFIPYVLLAGGYFLARISFLNFNDILSGVDYDGNYNASLKVRLLTFTYVFIKYLSLLFFPFNLHMAYEIKPVLSFFSWSVLEFLVAISTFFYLIKKFFLSNKLIIFAIFWFLILLLPRTNIISINRPLYEHWLYLPMLGFWLLFFILGELVLIKFKIFGRKRILLAGGLLLFLAVYFSFLTIRRNYDWHDPITFYEKNLRHTPQSFIQRNNLGMAYANQNRIDDSITQYRLAIAIKDVYPQVHYNLANSLTKKGLFSEAEEEYYRALDISPGFQLPYNNLMRLAIYQHSEKSMIKVCSKIKENFGEEAYLMQAFLAYYQLGEKDKARAFGQEALSKYPKNTELGLMMLALD